MTTVTKRSNCFFCLDWYCVFWYIHRNTKNAYSQCSVGNVPFIFTFLNNLDFGKTQAKFKQRLDTGIDISAFVCFDLIYFCKIWLLPYFWCTQIHTSSITLVFLSIQSNSIGNSEVRAGVCFITHIHTSSLTLFCWFTIP